MIITIKALDPPEPTLVAFVSQRGECFPTIFVEEVRLKSKIMPNKNIFKLITHTQNLHHTQRISLIFALS